MQYCFAEPPMSGLQQSQIGDGTIEMIKNIYDRQMISRNSHTRLCSIFLPAESFVGRNISKINEIQKSKWNSTESHANE